MDEEKKLKIENDQIDIFNENKPRDSEIDDFFDDLKQEINNKRNIQKSDLKKSGYYCKLCGNFILNKKEPIPAYRKCIHCKIPIDRKCRSCGFCLNCYINLTDDTQKTLKLMRLLVWIVPIFSISFLIYQDFLRFFLIELFLISFFWGLYYCTRRYINSHPHQYFDKKWEFVILNENYKKFLDPHAQLRYIDDQTIKEEYKKIEKRKKKLKTWIEPEKNFSDIPIPAYIEKINNKIDENFDLKENLPILSIPVSGEEINYKLSSCPHCNKEIKFADFCPSCNIKFCPECGIENSIYNRLCMCGFVFPILEDEFFKWTGTTDVEFVKKKEKTK